MKSLELFDISAKVSQKLSEWTPLYNKVSKVVDKSTFEMIRSETPVPLKQFWDDDHKHAILSAEQKTRIRLQYHRSKDIYGNVLAFVRALKELCDSGLPLFHEGIPVVDLWVLSTSEFDVSDVFESNVLWLTDPISGYTFPSLGTYENMDNLRGLSSDISRNIGIIPPEPDGIGEKLKTCRPEAYQGTMPYLWVAAIIEDERISGGKGRRMVHIDICASAFDDTGILRYNGSLVPLKLFVTPEYNIVATKNLYRAIRSQVFNRPTLIMQPCARSTGGLWQLPMLNFMPFGVRHLRCFHKINGSYIEMTPVDYFVSRNIHLMPGDIEAWSNFVTQLRHDIMTQVPIGAKIMICNLLQRPDLNGRAGRVFKRFPSANNRKAKKRIYVWVPKIDYPVGLRTSCFLLTKRSQYSSLEHFVMKAEEVRSTFCTEEDEMRTVSKRDKDAFETAHRGDPDLQLAFEVLTTGKLTILSFGNPSFVQGIKKFLSPPLSHILSSPCSNILKTGVEIADHPQAEEAFKILRLIKMSKEKVLEKDPSLMRGDGSMLLNEGSDFHQLMKIVGEKILKDDGLKRIFELMDEQNFFPFSAWDLCNPVV